MRYNTILSEQSLARAADQLVCDERERLIGTVVHDLHVSDSRNFKLEWADEDLTTGYILRGCVARAASYMTYSFTHQELGRPSSRLRFNEHASHIGIIDGPLKLFTCDMNYGQEQIYLGKLVHRALNNLLFDNYQSISADDTLRQ